MAINYNDIINGIGKEKEIKDYIELIKIDCKKQGIYNIDEEVAKFIKEQGANLTKLKLKDVGKYLKNDEEIAKFIKEQRYNLELEDIGDYLGDGENTEALKSFVDQQDFKGKPFIYAMRQLMQSMKLPGEAQKIDRVVEAFAEKYVKDNPKGISHDKSSVYLLAFQSILLNKDLHGSQTKKKMTFKEMVKNVNPDKKLYSVTANEQQLVGFAQSLSLNLSLKKKKGSFEVTNNENREVKVKIEIKKPSFSLFSGRKYQVIIQPSTLEEKERRYAYTLAQDLNYHGIKVKKTDGEKNFDEKLLKGIYNEIKNEEISQDCSVSYSVKVDKRELDKLANDLGLSPKKRKESFEIKDSENCKVKIKIKKPLFSFFSGKKYQVIIQPFTLNQNEIDYAASLVKELNPKSVKIKGTKDEDLKAEFKKVFQDVKKASEKEKESSTVRESSSQNSQSVEKEAPNVKRKTTTEKIWSERVSRETESRGKNVPQH